MRSVQEIVTRMNEEVLLFDFTREVIAAYLPLEDLKQFLKEDADISKMDPPKSLTREVVLAEMKDYMEFAWGQTQGHRGLSAGRSTNKMGVWIWLLGDDPIDADHAQYGAPILAAICDRYDFPVPQDVETQNMIQGDPCKVDCAQGCGQ